METVPHCRDNPAPARRSQAPAGADPNAGPANPSRPRGLTPMANPLCRPARAAA